MSLFSRQYRHLDATERKWAVMNEAVPAGYKMGKSVSGKALEAGMKVLAYYKSTNEGCDVVEILGVTNNNTQHGEGGPVFSSVKSMLLHHNCKTLAEVDQIDSVSDERHGGWGFHTYLYTRDISYEVNDKSSIDKNRQGAWYYIFEGRWARGSGAEKLSFVELLPIEVEPTKPSRFNLALED